MTKDEGRMTRVGRMTRGRNSRHSSFVFAISRRVFDEFTSVVDRNVARVVSAAVAKGIRAGQIGCRFVAVTCHYDVTEWLEPDWVIDMATATFTRRRLRRPPIELEIFRCRRSAWRMFARHHYLSGALPQYARCFLALWEGVPVAFCATVSLIGRKNRWRISRIVTLPDYQGVGIGMAVAEAVAELHVAEGHRVNVTGSHPAIVGPLPPLAAVEDGGREEDRLARHAEVHRELSRLDRPGRRVVRVRGEEGVRDGQLTTC